MAEGRLLFCVIYIRYQDCNDNTKYHQNDGEHFEITHKFALLSKISLCRDFYVIRGFSPSVEGLTAYRSLAVPDLILSEHPFYFNCYFFYRQSLSYPRFFVRCLFSISLFLLSSCSSTLCRSALCSGLLLRITRYCFSGTLF